MLFETLPILDSISDEGEIPFFVCSQQGIPENISSDFSASILRTIQTRRQNQKFKLLPRLRILDLTSGVGDANSLNI